MSKTKFDEAKAKKMLLAGASQSDVATALNVNRSTICRFVKKHADTLEGVQSFREHQPDVLSALQREAADIRFEAMAEMRKRGMKDLTNHELRSLNQSMATTQGIDMDKERLLSGKSTQNIASLVSIAVQQANKRDGIK